MPGRYASPIPPSDTKPSLSEWLFRHIGGLTNYLNVELETLPTSPVFEFQTTVPQDPLTWGMYLLDANLMRRVSNQTVYNRPAFFVYDGTSWYYVMAVDPANQSEPVPPPAAFTREAYRSETS